MSPFCHQWGYIFVTFFWSISSGSGTITNCVNFADVTGGTYVGGIIGANIVNVNETIVEVSNCINLGKINSNAESGYVGGIVGYSETQTHENCEISNCINLGEIASNNSIDSGIAYSFIAADNSTKAATVFNCINVGTMKGTSVYAIANAGVTGPCYYDNQKITVDTNSDNVVGRNDLANGISIEGYDNWSYDSGRYPVPNILATDGTNGVSDDVWQEILTAATSALSNQN